MSVLTSEIIRAGLRLSGVMMAPQRGPSPEESTESLAVLGDIIDQWNAQRYFVLSIGRKLFTVVSGQREYEIGPTAADWVTDRPPKIEDASLVLGTSSAQLTGLTNTAVLGDAFSRTLLVKDSAVGNDIADQVNTQAAGTATSVVAVLRTAISADLTIRIRLDGVIFTTMTIPLATTVGTVISQTTTGAILNDQAISWDILASDGSTDADGIASFTLEWIVTSGPGSGPSDVEGLEIPLTIITMDQYQLIPLKSTTSTYPQALWYNPAQEFLPNAIVTLWPVPSQTNSIALYAWSQMTPPALTTTPLLLGPGYKRALQYELAVELCMRYRRPVPNDLRMAQIEAVAKVKSVNAPTLDLRVDEALQGNVRGMWNWRTGNAGVRGTY